MGDASENDVWVGNHGTVTRDKFVICTGERGRGRCRTKSTTASTSAIPPYVNQLLLSLAALEYCKSCGNWQPPAMIRCLCYGLEHTSASHGA